MINWKVRTKNKAFWVAIIPALLLLVQVVANVFNVKLDFNNLNSKLLEVINAVFAVFAIIGIVNDPTTRGLSDSDRALTYDKPRRD